MNETKHHQLLSSTQRPALSATQNGRRLLAVGVDGAEHQLLKNHALELGARIGCEVVMLTLDPKSSPRTGNVTMATPADCGEHCMQYRAPAGDMGAAVTELAQSLKRIEFILTDSDAIKESLTETELTPVFKIMDSTLQTGGKSMANTSMAPPAKPIGKTILYGAITAALYAGIFWKADMVMNLFSRGGLYAALPITTAFVFSFAHGAFASNLWSLLGIQAKTTAEAYKSVSASTQPAKTKTKRPRARAYVNPFHNMELKSK